MSDEIQSWQQPDSNKIRELIQDNREYRQHHDHHHDQNYVFQLEDDMVIRKSAERKFARHPHNSILIQTTGDGSINNARFWQWKNNNPPGELEEITDLSEKEILLSKMGKKKRILLHGHGGQVQKKDGTGYKKVIANLGAEEVERRLQPFIQKISETGNLQQVRLVLLGCELVWPGERPTDDNSFLANLMRPLQDLAKRGIQVEGKASLHIQASSHLNLKTLILIEGFFYGHVITSALNKEEALADGFTSKVNFKYERNTEGVVTLKNVTEYNDKFSTDEIKWLQLRNQLEQPEGISFTTLFENILQPDKREKRFNKKMKNIFFQLIENTDLDNLPLEISGLKLQLQELKAEIKSTGSKKSVFEFIGDGEILLGLKKYQLRDYITYLVQVAIRTERKIFIQDSSFQAVTPNEIRHFQEKILMINILKDEEEFIAFQKEFNRLDAERFGSLESLINGIEEIKEKGIKEVKLNINSAKQISILYQLEGEDTRHEMILTEEEEIKVIKEFKQKFNNNSEFRKEFLRAIKPGSRQDKPQLLIMFYKKHDIRLSLSTYINLLYEQKRRHVELDPNKKMILPELSESVFHFNQVGERINVYFKIIIENSDGTRKEEYVSLSPEEKERFFSRLNDKYSEFVGQLSTEKSRKIINRLYLAAEIKNNISNVFYEALFYDDRIDDSEKLAIKKWQEKKPHQRVIISRTEKEGSTVFIVDDYFSSPDECVSIAELKEVLEGSIGEEEIRLNFLRIEEAKIQELVKNGLPEDKLSRVTVNTIEINADSECVIQAQMKPRLDQHVVLHLDPLEVPPEVRKRSRIDIQSDERLAKKTKPTLETSATPSEQSSASSSDPIRLNRLGDNAPPIPPKPLLSPPIPGMQALHSHRELEQQPAPLKQVFKLMMPIDNGYLIVNITANGESISGSEQIPNGKYFFVNRIDEPEVIRVAKIGESVAGHTSLTQLEGETEYNPLAVYYAGELIFEHGKLKKWTNGSGHYKPPADLHATNMLRSVQNMLPTHKFEVGFARYLPMDGGTHQQADALQESDLAPAKNGQLNTWQPPPKMVPRTDGGASQYDVQIIIQLEDNPIVAKAAVDLAAKHPHSLLFQLDSEGNNRLIYGNLEQLRNKKNVRMQMVGHGRGGRTSSNNMTLAGQNPALLANNINHFLTQQDIRPTRIVLAACSLVDRNKQDNFAERFIQLLERSNISVTAYSEDLGVAETGHKFLLDDEGYIVDRAQRGKILYQRDQHGNVTAEIRADLPVRLRWIAQQLDRLSTSQPVTSLDSATAVVLKDAFQRPDKQLDVEKLVLTLRDEARLQEWHKNNEQLLHHLERHDAPTALQREDVLAQHQHWHRRQQQNAYDFYQLGAEENEARIKVKTRLVLPGCCARGQGVNTQRDATVLGLAWLNAKNSSLVGDADPFIDGLNAYTESREKKVSRLVPGSEAEAADGLHRQFEQLKADPAIRVNNKAIFTLLNLKQTQHFFNTASVSGNYLLKGQYHSVMLTIRQQGSRYRCSLYDPYVGVVDFSTKTPATRCTTLQTLLNNYLQSKQSSGQTRAQEYGIRQDAGGYRFDIYRVDPHQASTLLPSLTLWQKSLGDFATKQQHSLPVTLAGVTLNLKTLLDMGATVNDISLLPKHLQENNLLAKLRFQPEHLHHFLSNLDASQPFAQQAVFLLRKRIELTENRLLTFEPLRDQKEYRSSQNALKLLKIVRKHVRLKGCQR
ncbi:C80 family cysteine peptidase [Candidatus Regiella endosymbiont of Tuberolachnus salignus]|uniref:C80 family cysteine peptidase n=1 Tax=Candidatus Regiella endosymbiont of Tuberolachnus salignus TaxID=3077956 RepID=UPI0030D3A777